MQLFIVKMTVPFLGVITPFMLSSSNVTDPTETPRNTLGISAKLFQRETTLDRQEPGGNSF